MVKKTNRISLLLFSVLQRDKIEALYKDFKADQTIKIEIERCLTCAQQREDS